MSSTDGTRPDEPAPGVPVPDVLVRRAVPEDAADCAEVVVAARRGAGSAFPPPVHTVEEDRAFFARRVCDHEVWLAEVDGQVVGHLDLDGHWVHSLYVHPRAQRRGVGAALLDLAKACRPEGFGLWVFATNERARAFYRRQGLLELETTDGSGNEEKAPDVRMVWPGPDPLAFLRHQIDLVDEELAAVVNRRVALTAAVQAVKDTPGHAGRDPEREAEIAARLAARTPGLDESDWTPVVHRLVETGLDVAERRRP